MIKFPFTTLQQFNLDWIMQQLHKILDFMPLNGSAGDVLQRTADGAAWQPIAAISMDIHSLQPVPDYVAGNDELPIYDNSRQGIYKATVYDIMEEAPVQSVNGMTGDILLNIPSIPVDSVNGQTGDVVLDASDVGALPDSYVAPVTSVNGQTGDVVISTGAVQSVNGQTGAVVLDADDVGALPDSYVAPVTSVNGQTGDVVVSGTGLTKTLLWSNPDTSEQFTAQTVAVDLSSYSLVMIEFILYGTLMTTVIANIPATTNSIANSAMYGQRFIGRNFAVSASGVTFEDGFYVSTYDGAVNTANVYMTPVALYGIK